ncbi:mitochondrial ribosome protein 63 domain-containing protein [Phthorimaea operculella]|nr:mitochondrial ribosome protein 63 domain-containing protein [Phthorimaea operculella]
MKLSLVLFRRNRLPNGHLFRGKDRLVKKVEPKHLRKIENEFAIEEQNMFYLRYPYLTEEESAGHSKALGKQVARIEALKETNRKIFKQDVTLYERLGHLRVKESWE